MVKHLLTLILCSVLCQAQLGKLPHHGHHVMLQWVLNDTDSGNVTTYATPSFTMEPNELYLVGVVTSDAASLTHTHSIASGHSGVSWTQIQTTTFNTPAAPTQRISVWRGSSTSRVSGTLTNTTSDAATGCYMLIVKAQHVDLSAPIVQSGFATNNTAAPGVTLSALGNPHENAVVLFVGGGTNPAGTSPTNSWSAIEPASADSGYNTPSTGMSFTYQSKARYTRAEVARTAAHWGAVAAELKVSP